MWGDQLRFGLAGFLLATAAATGDQSVEPGFAVTHTIEIKGEARVEPLSGTMAISTNHKGSNKLQIKDDAVVDGDAYCGPGADPNKVIDVDGSAALTGSKGDLDSAIDISESSMPGLGSSQGDWDEDSGSFTWSSDARYNDLKLSGDVRVNVTGNITIQVDSTFSVQDEAELTIAAGASLTVYVGNDVEFTGEARVNDAGSDYTRLTVYLINNKTAVIDDEPIVRATIHAAKGTLELKGEGQLYGRYFGKWAMMDDEARFYVASGGEAGPKLVFVVRNGPSSLTAQEQLRVTQLEAWGYNVVPIDAGDSQANFDTAIADAVVAYVSEEILSGDLGTKLVDATVGVVMSEQAIVDEFGIASSYQNFTDDEILITNPNHYITQPFSAGDLTITTSNQPLLNASGTIASGASSLAERPSGGQPALLALDAGASLVGGGTAAGRRVYLPWGGTSFDFASLNADGLMILQLALEWAGSDVSAPVLVDVTSEVGFDVQTSTSHHDGAGLHWADVDADGDLDALVTGNSSARLMINVSEGASFFASSLGNRSRQGGWIDIDNDGDLDFWHRDEVLYENDGLGGFVNDGDLGMSAPGNNEAVAVADVDADGWADVLMFSESGNYIGFQTGADEPEFTVTNDSAYGLNDSGDSGNGDFVSAGDVNNDGYLDFFYHWGGGKLFIANGDGTFMHDNRGISVTTGNNDKIGSCFGDYDNDGDLDLFVPRYDDNQPGTLWRNDGSVFTEVGAAAGITNSGKQRGSCWGDYDNDGDLDLYIAIEDGLNVLYDNNGDGTFTLSTAAEDVDGDGHDAVFVDIDNDGDLDLATTRMNGTHVILRNTTDNDASLMVRAIGAGAGQTNRGAIGVLVELYDAANTTFIARREIGVARGYGGTEPMWVHFGGVDPAATYTVRVHFNGQLITQQVVPQDVSTTIGATTIQRLLTIEEPANASQMRLIRWTEVDPAGG